APPPRPRRPMTRPPHACPAKARARRRAGPAPHARARGEKWLAPPSAAPPLDLSPAGSRRAVARAQRARRAAPPPPRRTIADVTVAFVRAAHGPPDRPPHPRAPPRAWRLPTVLVPRRAGVARPQAR